MKNLVALIVFSLTTLTLLGYQFTKALLSDSATSTNNTFTTASEFPQEQPLTSAMLKINEFSSNGDSNAEWVEIFNPTGLTVNVSRWSIEDALSSDIFPSVSPIPPNGFAVVVGSGSSVTIPGSATSIILGNSTIGNGLNNPGDSIRLRDASNVEIDALSYGTNTTVFPTPVPAPGVGQSTARIPNGIDTDSASNWQLDESPTLGVVNSL